MLDLISRSLRSLRRSPGFLAIATISLGAALGLSTAVFAFIDTITHPVMSFAQPEELRSPFLRAGVRSRQPGLLQQMQDMRQLDGVAAVTGARPHWGAMVTNDVVRQVLVNFSAPNYFDVIGVKPKLGRLPTEDERAAGSTVVVANAIWHTDFANRKAIGDAHLSVDGRDYTIVGVLPDGVDIHVQTAVFVMLRSENLLDSEQKWGSPIVRLKPGADSAMVAAQFTKLAAQYTQTNSTPDRPFAFSVSSFKSDPLRLATYHKAMLGAAFALLLIACANIAALLLARGVVRRRDYALRLALGASRATLALEVLTEVVVVTIVGGAIGAVVATWAVGGFTSALPVEFTWLGIAEPRWSVRVFGAAVAMALIAIAVAGALPAWLVTRVQPNEPLKDSAGTTTGRAGSRFRYLVMGELALSMTLLMGASLIAKGTRHISAFEFGYDARPLLEAVFYLAPASTTKAESPVPQAFAMSERVRSVPGVLGAAAFAHLGADQFVATSDMTVAGGDGIRLNDGYFDADARFFKTLGLPIAQGRDFTEGDRVGEGAAILNEAAAKALFPHGSALGRRVKMGDFKSPRPWIRVVGVVKEMRFEFHGNDRDFAEEPMIVTSTKEAAGANYWQMVIRPQRSVRGVDVAVQRSVRDVLPPKGYFTVERWIPNYTAFLRANEFVSRVFVMLGAASLILGAAGLFSVLSYVVGQRMREFAVRMALGADRPSVVRLVLRGALELSIGGTAVGAFLGMWSGSLLSRYLTNVAPTDVGALLTAEFFLVAVTMLASLLPALKAAKANPVDVLRAS